jgi:hypothetical protein
MSKTLDNLYSTWLGLPDDLLLAKSLVFDSCRFTATIPIVESENAAYGGYFFRLGDYGVRFRIAKITPKKKGFFVTCWRRAGDGSTKPFESEHCGDLLIVSVRSDLEFGQFVFSRQVLVEYGLVSVNGQGGKRGFRVYPPWEDVESRQARRTQAWQCKYFLNLRNASDVDLNKARMLYSIFPGLS